jgi:DNA polymerase III sliding clamp (beta) subunit (PCNA family)
MGLSPSVFRESMGLVTKEKVELFMRLIDGNFPDYTRLFLSEPQHRQHRAPRTIANTMLRFFKYLDEAVVKIVGAVRR